jgi:hypothetical protein
MDSEEGHYAEVQKYRVEREWPEAGNERESA